ncbi:MAG: LysM peptidoglycan-binding domain-containing protein [Candidatus Brocadiia bacterium]
MRRRRSRLWYLVPALIVGVTLYTARIWPFNRHEAPPPGSITTGGTAGEAYEQLGEDFRAKVPLAEFATMLGRMTNADQDSELPTIRSAGVSESAGPEPPMAHFEVRFPTTGTDAEYHFARRDGEWELRSFRIVEGGWQAPAQGYPPPAASAKSPAPKAERAEEKEPPEPRPAASRRFPCEYTIQGGDNLGAISRHFYGTTRYWRRILEANPGLREKRLRIGRKITIPVPPEPLSRDQRTDEDSAPQPEAP